MKTRNNTPAADSNLLARIEKYFDCALSDSEEQQLRREIAETRFSHPAIDEVRALMGFRRPPVKHRTARPYVAVAASVAVILLAAVNLMRPAPVVADSTCIAYVDGQRVTDEDAVMSILAENMSDFSEGLDEANDSLVQGLTEAAADIDDYQNNIAFPEI